MSWVADSVAIRNMHATVSTKKLVDAIAPVVTSSVTNSATSIAIVHLRLVKFRSTSGPQNILNDHGSGGRVGCRQGPLSSMSHPNRSIRPAQLFPITSSHRMTALFIDGLIILVYFVGIICIGLYMGRREKTLHDFALGGRRVPWWA